MKKKKLNWSFIIPFILIVLIVVGIFGYFIIRPAWIGYSTYSHIKDSDYTLDTYGKNINDLQSQVESKNNDLALCSEDYKKLGETLTENNKLLATCSADKKEAEEASVKFKADYDELNDFMMDTVNGATSEVSLLTKKYDALVQNVANNLCCKARYDNPTVDSYEIVDDMIKCRTGLDLKISC